MAFHSLSWKAAPVDGELALEIRTSVRQYRRERGRAGHRFSFKTLKNLWVAESHAVLNHKDDPSWQYWHYDARTGWDLIAWYGTRREAQAAAEMPHPERREPKPTQQPESGIFVFARWPKSSYDRIKVHCTSHSTCDDIMKVLFAIGMEARKDVLSQCQGAI